ncbi:MAG: 4Fe-4S binding protein [Calditrichaeota bacterium]|nr:MAG: 4Fe-4S binding protein [Calditrichota bacterium]
MHKKSDIQILRWLGLLIFLLGFTVFTASIFLGHYQIDASTVQKASEYIPQEQVQLLNSLSGTRYASILEAIQGLENTLNPEHKLPSYQWNEYKFWIIKSAARGVLAENPSLFLLLTIGLGALGALLFILPGLTALPGIKNDGIFFRSITSKGLLGILLGGYLIAFYIILYWYPEYIVNLIILVDPVSEFLRNKAADRWFLYGFLYTVAVTVMGIRMFIKYRHNRYQLIRTGSVIFFQFGFAFMIPSILERFNQPSMDLKNAWPLNYTFFMDWNIKSLLNSGNLGIFLFLWGILLSFVIVPLFTYLFGKRWYCSWVCGCGGLAETLGDPFRQLSSKTLKAWRIERIMIYSVLVFAVVMTVLQISNFLSNGALFGSYTWRVNKAYSFFIGSIFAGVVGTGFYPLMGNRVWCRFGCPLAAIMGIVQKFKSRFVITTNGSQCISCGNCSTYCEMGIDVRWYAQRGQNIVRASCVGCGICAAVCPRGVLKLETTDPDKRYNVVLDDLIVEAMKTSEELNKAS